MKHLLIIGARGWGREVYATFINSRMYEKGDYDVKGFLDDNSKALDGLKGDWPPIIGSVEEYEVQPDDVFFCAMGDAHWRKHYAEIISSKGGQFINIIDRLSWISPSATIGEGIYVGPLTMISTNVSIGNHAMIQAYTNIGHDATIGNYASLESYIFMGGYSSVGELSTMHTKSSIIPHKSVGKECVVGFGSVVMRHFKDGTHVFGNPATKLTL